VRSEKEDQLILQAIGTEVTEMMQAQTELQRAQGQLRNYAASLENEVGERTAKLQETVRSLEGVCYHLVHDLRAPLRAMQGFTSLLLQEYGGHLDARAENYAHRICDSATRMDRLITDLLEFGNVGHMPLRTSEVSLADAIESARDELKKAIRATDAEITVEGPLPKVLGNAGVLQKVFRHLLSNALTFTVNSVAPRIKIWAEQADDLIRVFVKDNGMGIPEEYRDRIFGIFERLHSDQSYPGTGIGLAIVSKAVERMDGRVGFESQPGKGSTFWIELRPAPH
jgi:signal transduction histidine kinase